MEILKLLTRAQSAGLTVEAQEGQLVVRGPKQAAPIAKELGAHKAAVMAALAATSAPPSEAPSAIFGRDRERPSGAAAPCPRRPTIGLPGGTRGEPDCSRENGSRMYAETKTWNPFKGCRFECMYCGPSFRKQSKRQKQICDKCYRYAHIVTKSG